MILVTGATGMLGLAAVERLSRGYEVFATASREPSGEMPGAASFAAADLARGGVDVLAARCAPDVIVNCAAMTDVDSCEKHPDEARAINEIAPAELAERFPNSYIIHISTDAVFDPSVALADEDSPKAPAGVYGTTKLAGERALLASSHRACVLRTTVVGVGGRRRSPSLAEWMIKEMRARKRLRLFTDAFFTPISVWDLARVIELAIERRPVGVFHAAGGERISKHDFGAALARACGFDEGLIDAARLADTAGASIRRLDQSLSSKKLEREMGIELPNASMCAKSIAERVRR